MSRVILADGLLAVALAVIGLLGTHAAATAPGIDGLGHPLGRRWGALSSSPTSPALPIGTAPAFGWRPALAFWVVLAGLGFALWLPTLLGDEGIDAKTAGYMLMITNLTGAVAALVLPVFIKRLRTQRPPVVAVTAFYLVSLLGLLVARRPVPGDGSACMASRRAPASPSP